MIRYDVTNVASGKITNTWTSDEHGSDYYEPCFGKPQRTLVASEQGIVLDIDGSQANISLAISTGTTVDINGVTVNTYLMPAEYTVTATDITAQVAVQQAVVKGMLAQQAGAQIIAQVYAINETNLQSGALTTTLFGQMLADTSLANIERLLWNGSLATALTLIQESTSISNYFSSTQIVDIENAVSAAIAAL